MMISREFFFQRPSKENLSPLQKRQAFVFPYFMITSLFYRPDEQNCSQRSLRLPNSYSYLLWFSLLFASIASSEELQENFFPIRALGMGNAFTAIVNDESSIWLNPAAISRVRKHRSQKSLFFAKMPVLGLGVNTRGKAIFDTKRSQNSTMQKAIESSGSIGVDKSSWGHFQAAPVLMYNLDRQLVAATSLYVQGFVRMFVTADDPTTASLRAQNDMGFAQSLAWTNSTNRMSLGLTFRYINRGSYEDSVPTEYLKSPLTMQQRYYALGSEALGYGLDFGFIYTFADFWFPTFGLSILNLPVSCQEDYLNPANKKRQTVCGTKFSGAIRNPDAMANLDPTDIRVGLSMTPRLSKMVALRLGLDIHHLYTKLGSHNFGLEGIPIQKMTHGGVELLFGNPLLPSHFSVRAGMGQGFFSAGVSAWIYGLEMHLTTYAVDLSSDSKALEDRRTLAGLAYAW